jgi:hypothetical protein
MASLLAALAPFLWCSVPPGAHGAETTEASKGREDKAASPTSEDSASSRPVANQRSGLKDLEERLFKPLKNFSPESSLNGVTAAPLQPPSTPSPIPSRKARELMDRKKNWVFMTPEEFMAGPSQAEMFKMPEYGPDGQETKKLSVLEQFYHNLDQKPKPPGKKESLNNSDSLVRPPFGGSLQGKAAVAPEEDPSQPDGLTDTERTLRKLFHSESGENVNAPNERPSSFSDIFKLDKFTPVEKTDAQKARFEEYRRMLQGPAVTSVGGEMSPAGGLLDDPLKRGANGTPGLTGLPGNDRRSSYDSQLGTISPILKPTPLPEAGPRLSNPGSLTPLLPKIDPPKVTPPTPTFAAPKRAF